MDEGVHVNVAHGDGVGVGSVAIHKTGPDMQY